MATRRRRLLPAAEANGVLDLLEARKPYSPETLADRWGCSAEKVRIMYRNGEIGGFRLGKLIRIPAAEVERYECQTTDLSNTGEGSASPTRTGNGDAFASRLARMTEALPRHAPANCGGQGSGHQATG